MLTSPPPSGDNEGVLRGTYMRFPPSKTLSTHRRPMQTDGRDKNSPKRCCVLSVLHYYGQSPTCRLPYAGTAVHSAQCTVQDAYYAVY